MLELLPLGMLSLFLAAISLFAMEQGGELVRKLAMLFSILSAIVNTACLFTSIVKVISISMHVPASLEELPVFFVENIFQVMVETILIIFETVLMIPSYIVLKRVLDIWSMGWSS